MLVPAVDRAQCRHCGQTIGLVPYGSGTRWVHVVMMIGVEINTGSYCPMTVAEPAA